MIIKAYAGAYLDVSLFENQPQHVSTLGYVRTLKGSNKVGNDKFFFGVKLHHLTNLIFVYIIHYSTMTFNLVYINTSYISVFNRQGSKNLVTP